MDLEEMKHIWEEVNQNISPAPSENTIKWRKIISASRKTWSSLNRIIFMESLGILMALVMGIYLISHFHKLITWLDLLGGYATLGVLFLSLGFGGRLILEASSINIASDSYSQVLNNYNRFKKSLGLYKRLSIAISFVLPFVIFPVFARLYFNKDLLADFQDYTLLLITSFIFSPIALFLIFKYYKWNMRRVKEGLADLEEEME